MIRAWQIVRQQRRPVKFLVSRLLMRTGLAPLWTIGQGDFLLRFFPTSLSAALWIDPADHQAEVRFFRRYLRPGDVVIDVGANVGLTTLAAAKAVGDSGRVIAVEPHPRIFRYLQNNLALNGVRNVAPHNVACGETEGTLRLSDMRSDDQNFVGAAGHSIEVPVRRLDDLLAAESPRGLSQFSRSENGTVPFAPARSENGTVPLAPTLAPDAPIALLKIDVEGYEKLVLEGAPETLRRTECVHFESWDGHFARYGYRSPDVFRSLADHGFTVLRPVPSGRWEPIPEGYSSAEIENLVAVRHAAGSAGFSPLDAELSP